MKFQLAGGPDCCEAWQPTRREFVQAVAAGALGGTLLANRAAGAPPAPADVAWLAEVQTPPAEIPREDVGPLESLLTAGDGEKIETLEQWKAHRAELRRRWLEFLGPMPEDRPPVELSILREECLEKHVRQLVRYESEADEFVEGYLLQPADLAPGERRAAVLGLHQTTPDTIEQIAGVKGPDSMQIGRKLCERGFVVFCPRCFLWQSATDYRQAVERFQQRHPRTLGMHKMLYDAMRGVDVLAALPHVDPRRIGAAGHSLGAKETLYVAAFDERIQAAVASEGGTGFRSTNWNAPWYLGPAIEAEKFPLNHHQLLALIAPRPFLILAGEVGRGAADGDRSWPYIEAALPVWKLYGSPARLGIHNHRQGHSLPEKAFERMAEWLQVYLRERTAGESR